MPADAPLSDIPFSDLPITDVSVVIPARDEQHTLHACLASVDRAIDELGRRHPSVAARVILVLDRCTDDSARIAARFAQVIVIEADAGSVGAARALGVAAAEQAAPATATHWIANTDADSSVPPHWLTVQLQRAHAGADVWVGTVTPVLDELDEARRAQWLRSHPPGASIGHVHGANLGFRAASYRDVGGFEHVPEHEDVRLVERAARAGARVAASDAADVRTSARLRGRTPGGYAGYLAAITDIGEIDEIDEIDAVATAGGDAAHALPV